MTTKKHLIFNSLFFLTLVVSFMFQSCEKKETPLLKQKTFTAVLTELMIIEKLGTDDAHKTALAKALLDSFKITAEEFQATTNHYKNNPDFWLKIYKRTEEKISEKEKQLQKK